MFDEPVEYDVRYAPSFLNISWEFGFSPCPH
jgi:hypothetical protein